ncbi:hypothetical protein O0S10_06675 [Methanocorpusculum sp. MG]|uniref:RadC-like JAB domain-containing protein n=1 Tax=Methanocorpusculum petauri TaxID=3002863 RepID=A0ABT4IIC5_9EURY|nr:hypothetical protein [Methanocorpusculum petauri]MCZ0860910.1 hypothetical protein [Methanocorpusculum petauri]
MNQSSDNCADVIPEPDHRRGRGLEKGNPVKQQQRRRSRAGATGREPGRHTSNFFGGVMATKKKQMDNTGKLPFSALHEIALKEARKIHREKVEHAAVIDEQGNVTRFVGDVDGVDIPAYLYEGARIIVHNHPHDCKEPSSFSGDDVYNLLYFNLDEIIACGYGYYFHMRKNTCILRSIDAKRKVYKIYDDVVSTERKIYQSKGVSEIAEIKKEYWAMLVRIEKTYHKKLMEFASEKALTYGRSKL